MSKPTWKPVITPARKLDSWRFCQCCGWRETKGQFCGECELQAKLAPPQRPRPTPIRVPASTRPSNRTIEQTRYIESILPVTCALCGAGDHTSASCPRNKRLTPTQA